MNVLLDLLQSQIGGESFNETVSNQMGIEKEKAGDAVQAAFSALMAGLSNNVKDENGAQGLLGALDRDHDGSVLDNVMDLMSGTLQTNNPSMLNGAGILNHILGNNQSNVIETIAKVAGIDTSKAGGLLIKLAPIVLGLLGRMKRTNNVQNSSLIDLILQSGRPQQQVVEQPQTAQTNGLLGVFGKLLDKDNDGNIMDDIASSGLNMVLKNILK